MKNLFVVVIMVCTVSVLKAQTFNPLLADMLQDTLDTYVSQISSIKGLSASVNIPGQGTWTGVYGDSYSGQPISDDMRFGIASNSKLFVSVMMLKLAENNIINLEDSLHQWLPISNPNINPNISIRQLLNHSSGISDPFIISPWYDTINANPTRVFTPNEVLGWVGEPLFQAGTSWGYSNTNYVIAGMVAQSATGYSLATLIRDSILTPLNLNSTFFDVDEPENGIIAHRWWNTLDYHDTSRVGLNTSAGYAGSLFSTASEMVQWYNALFSGQVITPSSINELTTFLATLNPNYQYGLGLSREITLGYPYWGHGGSTWGYKSKMIYDSCLHVSVAGLSNSFPSGMDGVTFLLYRAIKNHIPGCSDALIGTDTICEGTPSIIYSVPPIPNATSYQWILPSGVTGSSNTNSITVNVELGAHSGFIHVTGINDYGPGGSSSLRVTVQPIPPTPEISLNGNLMTSNAPAGNQWYNSSGIINGATNSTYSDTTGDHYYCIVTLYGCSSDTSNIINTMSTGIVETSFPKDLIIYPNPTSDRLTISSDLNITGVELYDNNGKQIYQSSIGKEKFINLQQVDPGFYLLHLLTQDGTYITKIIRK